MVSTYTTNKVIEKPASGDYANAWAAPVNTDWDIIDQAFGGVTSLNATAGSVTLSAAQYRSLSLSVAGAMSANVTYTIPSTVGGQWMVYNSTTEVSGGPYTVTIASGGGGTSVVIERNKATNILSDGTNIRSVYAESLTAVTPPFASGTAMLFVQTSAPTGWTKSTTHDNKALRVVSGAASSGGTTGFTSVFTSRTITTANMPVHTHGVTDPQHTHDFSSVNSTGSGTFFTDHSGSDTKEYFNTTQTVAASTGISIQNAGSGTAMDFAVRYVDVIIATKD